MRTIDAFVLSTAQLSEESCSCGDSGFACPDAPCTTEAAARRACVDG